jgi:hypothetical protein
MKPKSTRDAAGLYNFCPARNAVNEHASYVADRTVVDEHALGVPVPIDDAPTTRYRVDAYAIAMGDGGNTHRTREQSIVTNATARRESRLARMRGAR